MGRWKGLRLPTASLDIVLHTSCNYQLSRDLCRYDAGAFEYFAPSSSLFAVELFLFAWVEGRRYQASKGGVATSL